MEYLIKMKNYDSLVKLKFMKVKLEDLRRDVDNMYNHITSEVDSLRAIVDRLEREG